MKLHYHRQLITLITLHGKYLQNHVSKHQLPVIHLLLTITLSISSKTWRKLNNSKFHSKSYATQHSKENKSTVLYMTSFAQVQVNTFQVSRYDLLLSLRTSSYFLKNWAESHVHCWQKIFVNLEEIGIFS